MTTYFTYRLLFAYLALLRIVLADLAFRCSSCTAEHLAVCPQVAPFCPEIVREMGCGCCPVCARQEGELCGVYTPRCSSGLRCYPSAEAEFPLQELIQGLGRCGPKVDLDITASLEDLPTYGKWKLPLTVDYVIMFYVKFHSVWAFSWDWIISFSSHILGSFSSGVFCNT